MKMRDISNANVDFERWMKAADKCLVHMIGLESMDLSDWHWYDAYDAGDNPAQAAMDACQYWQEMDGMPAW